MCLAAVLHGPVRELLKYEEAHITLAYPDTQMVESSVRNPQMTALNKNSLDSDRLMVVNTRCDDEYLKESREKFDVDAHCGFNPTQIMKL